MLQTVEATAANGTFIFKADNSSEGQAVPRIAGYAILLPTILSVMYGQGEWPEESVSVRYGKVLLLCQNISPEFFQKIFKEGMEVSQKERKKKATKNVKQQNVMRADREQERNGSSASNGVTCP